jgi:hypothetical protein
MELQEFIKQELGLNGTPQENIAKLLAKREEIRKVNDQIDLAIKDAEKVIFKEWQTIIFTKYPDYTLVEEEGARAGLIVPVNDSTSVRVSIGFDSQLFCQIDMDIFEGQNLPEEIKKKTKHLLPRENSNNQIWKYFPRYEYNRVFDCLQEVLSVLTK